MTPPAPSDLARAAQLACVAEAATEKPGNVTPTRAFHDCTYEDFLASAVAVGPAFGAAGEASVGQTILRAVRATRALVETNTNLGIVLLLAPLARAAALAGDEGDLRAALQGVLRGLDREDARDAYAAIRLARPAAMGEEGEYDVARETPEVTLLQAMELARERDSVAREYCTDYAITFTCGLPALTAAWAAGHGLRACVLRAYLETLAEVPDTLIARKLGRAAAERVSHRAAEVLAAQAGGAEVFDVELARFDAELRDDGHRLNPGTTADLVCAALFVFLISRGAPRELGPSAERW